LASTISLLAAEIARWLGSLYRVRGSAPIIGARTIKEKSVAVESRIARGQVEETAGRSGGNTLVRFLAPRLSRSALFASWNNVAEKST
jgi:hypothetical protein